MIKAAAKTDSCTVFRRAGAFGALFLALVLLLCFHTPFRALAGEAGPAAAPDSARKLRIIALGAPAVETMYALGLGDCIIARATWDNWPPSVRNVPHVGSPDAPNLELIMDLKPDMVLVDGHYVVLQKRLNRLGVPCELFSAYNTPDVIPGIEHLAAKLNCRKKARPLIEELRSLATMIAERLKGLNDTERPSGMTLAGTVNFFTFSDMSGRRLLQLAGAANAAADFDSPYPTVSREWLLYNKPDFLLVSPYSSPDNYKDLAGILKRTHEHFALRSPIADSPTVQAGNLIVLDGPISYGLRSHFGVLYLAKRFHPERFADVDPDELYFSFLRRYFNFYQDETPIYP